MTLDYFINNSIIIIKILILNLYNHDWFDNFDFKMDSICQYHPWSFRHDLLFLESRVQIEMTYYFWKAILQLLEMKFYYRWTKQN